MYPTSADVLKHLLSVKAWTVAVPMLALRLLLLLLLLVLLVLLLRRLWLAPSSCWLRIAVVVPH